MDQLTGASLEDDEVPALEHPGPVICESYLVYLPTCVRVEDDPEPGTVRCTSPAVWRVTFRGRKALGNATGVALRLKCDPCAQAAVDAFGSEFVTLRRLGYL